MYNNTKSLKYIILIFIIVLLSKFSYTQDWEGLGFGLGSTQVNQISQYRCLYNDTIDNKLYIGGRVLYANDTNYSGIVAWDGNYLSSLGDSISSLFNTEIGDYIADVRSIIRYKNEIYAGGQFYLANSNIVNSIARWNGSEWHSVGCGLIKKNSGYAGTVLNFHVFDDTLYINGYFDSICGSNIQCDDGMVKWDGANWHEVESLTTTNSPSTGPMAKYKNEIYVAGNFGNFTDTIKEIARWNGTQWCAVGGGILGDSWVQSLVVYKDYLYVGGYFYEQDGNKGSFIMRWDGEEWSNVGGGMEGVNQYANGQIHSMHVFNDELWVGGVFSHAGGIPAKYLAKWDGTKWCSLGTDINAGVYFVSSYNNELYIAGGFSFIDNMQIPFIAKSTIGSYIDTCSTPTNIIELQQKEDEIIVYPNPSNTILNISISNNSIQTISIYNPTGQLVLQTKANTQKQSIDISDLPVGSYFIRIVGKNNVWAEKFLIMR